MADGGVALGQGVARLPVVFFLRFVESKLIDLAQIEGESLSGTVENKPEAIERMLSQLEARQHTNKQAIGEPGLSVAEDVTEDRLVLEAELLSEELQRLLLKVYVNLLI